MEKDEKHDVVGKINSKKGLVLNKSYESSRSFHDVENVTLMKTIKDSLMSLLVCCLPDKDFVVEDVREKQTHMASYSLKSLFINKNSASNNLEDLPHSSLVILMFLLYFSIVFSIAFTAIITFMTFDSALLREKNRQYAPLEQVATLNGLEGILRIVATLVLLWLLLSFPQRCIVHAITNRTIILPEQIILIITSVIVMITPIYSVVAFVFYWIQFDKALDFVEIFPYNVSEGFAFQLTFYALESLLEEGAHYSRGMIVIQRSWMMLAIGIFTSILGRKYIMHSINKKNSGNKISGDNGNTTSLQSKKLNDALYPTLSQRTFQALENGEDDFGDEPAENLPAAEPCACTCSCSCRNDCSIDSCSKKDEDCQERCADCEKTCYSTCKFMFPVEVRQLSLLIIIYTIIYLIISMQYSFSTSVAPLAGLITVIRVCIIHTTCVQYENSTRCDSDAEGLGNCSPKVLDGVVYARAVSVLIMTIVEIFIIVFLHLLSRETSRRLKRLDYRTSRSKHMGYRFFRSNKNMIFIAMLIVILLATLIPDANYWIFRAEQGTTKYNDTGLYFVYDPLHTVGISYSIVGLGGYYMLLAALLFSLEFAYLPPKSYRWKHWWIQNTTLKDVSAGDIEHPSYLMLEEGIIALRKMRMDLLYHEQMRAKQAFSRWAKVQLQRRYLHRMYFLTRISPNIDLSSPAEDETKLLELHSKPEIVEQIESNVIVMETEVLMWNFAHIAYELGSGSLDIPDDSLIFDPDTDDEAEFIKDEDNNKENKNNKNDMKEKELPSATFKEIGLATDDDAEDNIDPLHLAEDVKIPTVEQQEVGKDGVPNDNLTREQKQAIVGDPNYRFIAHFESKETDTQCALFFKNVAGDNRIVVCFRGTVTTENMKTDMDFTFIPFPAAKAITPLRDDDSYYAGLAALDPIVHRGFIRAYASVRKQLLTCIDKILERYPDAVIFSTGHSLGGALAVVFGFDMGLCSWRAKNNLANSMQGTNQTIEPFIEKLHVINFAGDENEEISLLSTKGRVILAIQISTFGCPRIGNYSLVQRIRRLVPTIHRFVVQSDIIPKLNTIPSTTIADFLRKGYQHVGVEMLMDLDGNMIIGPKFVERAMMHGWRGVSAVNHLRGTYTLALMFWIGRVHGGDWIPNFWINIVNNLFEQESKKLQNLKPEDRAIIHDQLWKEGAQFYDSQGKKCTSTGVQVGSYPLDFDLEEMMRRINENKEISIT